MIRFWHELKERMQCDNEMLGKELRLSQSDVQHITQGRRLRSKRAVKKIVGKLFGLLRECGTENKFDRMIL